MCLHSFESLRKKCTHRLVVFCLGIFGILPVLKPTLYHCFSPLLSASPMLSNVFFRTHPELPSYFLIEHEIETMESAWRGGWGLKVGVELQKRGIGGVGGVQKGGGMERSPSYPSKPSDKQLFSSSTFPTLSLYSALAWPAWPHHPPS